MIIPRVFPPSTLPPLKGGNYRELFFTAFLVVLLLHTFAVPPPAPNPLEFWFCRNIGLALPLIALQYHEVKINLTLT